MPLAAPDYDEHRLSINLCLVSQRQPGHTYWEQTLHIQTMSSLALLAFKWRESESLR